MSAIDHDDALRVLRGSRSARPWQQAVWPALLGLWVGLRATVDWVQHGFEAYRVLGVLVGCGLIWFAARQLWPPRTRKTPFGHVTQLHHVVYEQHRPSGKRILRDRLGQAWLPARLPRGLEFGDVLWSTPIAEGRPFALVPLSGHRVIHVDRAERWADEPV